MGFGKDGKGAILRETTEGASIGTPTSTSVTKLGQQLAISNNGFRIIKMEGYAWLENVASGEGPLFFGIASNDLSAAEIAEALNVDGPLSRADRVAMEQAERPVWVLGFLPEGAPAAAQYTTQDHILQFEKVLKWSFQDSVGWAFFVWNMSDGTLTTGSVVGYHVKHYGVWLD